MKAGARIAALEAKVAELDKALKGCAKALAEKVGEVEDLKAVLAAARTTTRG